MAIWQFNDGAWNGVGGLIFDADANTNGTMFDFHSLTINGQRHFSVAGLVNGGFVTVYEDRVGGDLNCYY